MSWPTPQEYNEAIQTPQISFADTDLQKGSLALTPMGMPKVVSGAFASVYKVSAGGNDWAVRCFLSERPDQSERYRKISEFVLMDELSETVDFHYVEKGIRVHGSWYPILKMQWVYGQTLELYLQEHYADIQKIEKLLQAFDELADRLEKAGIAHGDLQHGNIIVCQEGLRLVDYDALYVPALSGKMSLELGHPNYQHPLRTQYHYDEIVDNFSCWLIHYSLFAISKDPGLFERFIGGDECILFRRGDLRSPETSKLFNELLHHQSVDIRGGARLILRMLWASPDEIPELNAPDAELEKLPDVKPSKVDSEEAAKRAELYFIDDESTTNRFELDADVLVAAPNLVVPRISDEESFRARISRKWKGIESRINKVLFPAHWYHVSMKEAEKLARQGKHEEASRIQLAVYASLSSSLSFSFWFIDVEFDLLIALGYSFAAQSNWNLAQNYFFLATKSLYRSKSIIAKERLTLLLAIVRALKGDLKDAQNLLLKDSSLLRNLSVLLPKEMKHSFVTRPEVLALFLDLPRASVEKLDQRELIGLAEAIICLHQSIKDRTSIRLDKQTLYVYFRLTSIRQTWRDWQKCALEFHQAVEVCRMVANKLSHDKQTGKEVVDGDLGALLSAAAMEPSVCFPERRHWRFFKYAWRMEVALTGLEKVEKFDNALLCDLYEYCGSQEWFANRLDYWLILAMKGGHKNSVEALKSILVNLSDHQTIVFCMQYLIDNGHYRDLLEVADGLRSSKGREVFVGLVIHAYRCGCLTTSGYLARSLFVSGNDFQRRQFLFMLMEEEAIGVLPYVYHQFIASSEKARVEALTSLFIRNLESTTFMSPRPMVFLDEYIRLLYKVTCSYIKRGQNPDADTFVESVECELSNSFGSR